MKKRLLSLLLVFVMVLGMLPISAFAASAPFVATVGGAEMTDITKSTLTWTDMYTGESADVTCYTVKVPKDSDEATLDFNEDKQWSYYDSTGAYVGDGPTSWTAAASHTVAIQDSNGDGELDGISVQIPDAYSTEYFILFVYSAGSGDAPTEDTHEHSYDSAVTTQPTCTEDGIKTFSCSCGDSYTEPVAATGHSYANGTCANCGGADPDYVASDDPFLSIKIGGVEIAVKNITYKGIFELGDYADDEQQGETDSYDYVHEVPYYHVIVPCGTGYVDVTYSAQTNILSSGSNAYGYKTDLEVDAVSSATVRGATFSNAYTKNEDGTQTVKTPVTGYTFDEDGNGHAITLEQDGGNYEAVCLFTFGYDGINHVYDGGIVTTDPTCSEAGVKTFTCSCGHSYTEAVAATGHSYADGVCANCGEADPDYVAPSAEIPEGTNIEAITAVTEFKDGETISYYQWGSPAGDAPSYVATVPEGTQTVTITFKSGTHPDPYGTDVKKLSGARAYYYYNADTDESYYDAGGKEATATQDDNGLWSIELNVADFLYTEQNYYGAYDASYGVQYFLAFQYPEGAHEHSYSEEVTTQPTCTEDGIKTFSCSCGDSYTEPVAATGHSYDNGVVTTNPTCTEAGAKTFTCSQCAEGTTGHTKTETVPATGHNYQNGKCENCGEVCPLQDENGAFQIGTYEELLWFAKTVNGGETAISGVLTADITLPEDWPGIGIYGKAFTGSFDGQNHTVTLSGSTFGLFGYAMGTHTNHTLKDAAIIQNVITAGTVKNSALVHSAGYARITNCINKADVVGENSKVAGIVGSVSGSNRYGMTYSDVQIINCANEGDIRGDRYLGGIVGYTNTNTHLNGCANTGSISGSSEIGGLAGYMQGAGGSCSIKNSYNKGSVTGGTITGGIIGQLYNGVSITACYNAGASTNAITGYVYNKTATATNTYYRSDLSGYDAPEYYQNKTSAGFNTTVYGAGKGSAEMGGASFAALLGDAFKESCGGPVLTWQTATAHDLTDGVCYTCQAGHTGQTVKAKYNVHTSTGGYEIVGDTIITEGNDYTFAVNVLPGYYAADSFAVYVNGTAVTALDGVYTVLQPNRHLYVTVTGVKELEGVLPVSLPGTGEGYRVAPCEGYSTTVESGKDFKFTVTFVDGFKAGKNFAVKVNSVAVTPDAQGIYTIENVMIAQTITVENVDIISRDSVTVNLDVTRGEDAFMQMEETGIIMMDEQFTVPYFDLNLYGLERCYYNPYCYVDEAGNIRNQAKAGNRETAYGVVTTMHALIYMTELYYLGYDEDLCGTGYSHTQDQDGDGTSDFEEAANFTAGVGSTFVYLWGSGSNLNYHLNYTYPIAYPGWGSTSDQQALHNGDVISIHFITGSASGSSFGFFAVNDENNTYDGTEQKDHATLKQGETLKLTHYIASQGDNYTTAFVTGGSKDLYWVEQGNESYNVEVELDGEGGNWYRDGFGTMTADAFKTNENGEIIIDTTNLEPGTYYIAARGGFVEGSGEAGSDGFVSRGAESGPAYFTLTVEESDEINLGDINNDSIVDVLDANLVVSFIAGKVQLTAAQEAAADADGSGAVDLNDAALIVAVAYGKK